MIHSAINDNWKRVEMMHSVVRSLYLKTYDSDFRERSLSNSDPFPFDTEMFGVMNEESCMVGMAMVWSVVFLESLANHALAEKINNKLTAITAIEFPQKIIVSFTKLKSCQSDLSKKLMILLGDPESIDTQHKKIAEKADKISKIRNGVVHDKPFEMIDLGEGEVKITDYKTRDENKHRYSHFNDLKDFYSDCEQVKNYIANICSDTDSDFVEYSFKQLDTSEIDGQ